MKYIIFDILKIKWNSQKWNEIPRNEMKYTGINALLKWMCDWGESLWFIGLRTKK